MTHQGKHKIGFKASRKITKISALLVLLTASLFIPMGAAKADITNQATASGDYAGLTTTTSPANAAVPVAPSQPIVGLVKTAGAIVDVNANGQTDAGDTIAYTFTVSNLGNVTLNPVSVTDPKVANITCASTTLIPGASTVCTAPSPYVLTQADIDAGTVANQATASGTPPIGAPVTDLSDPTSPAVGQDGPTTVSLPATPKIGLVKSAGAVVDANTNGLTDVGDTITYTFTVSNLGNVTLNPVAVTDPKIANITCLATSLAPTATTTCSSAAPYVLTQADLDAGKASNQATASGKPSVGPAVTDLSDPTTAGPGSNAATDVPLTQSPKIGVVKTAGAIVDANSNGVQDAGDTIAYTFTVSNLGTVTLNPVSVVDPKVPAITCVATSLAPSATTTCTSAAPYALTQADVDAGSISNQATASGKPPVGPAVTDLSDPTTPAAGNDNPTVTTITPSPKVSVLKTAGAVVDANTDGKLDAGDTIAYTFTAANLGNVTLSLVNVTDPKVPSITCVATTLAPGATTSCSAAVYTLTQADIDSGSISNQATVSAKPPVGPAVTDLSDPTTQGSGPGKDDPTVVALPAAPAIGLVKAQGTIVDVNSNGVTDVGDTIGYTFTVSNLGTVTLNPISVVDPKVPNITCLATSLAPGASTTCTPAAPYALTQADINSGSVSNQATASGKPPSGPVVTDLSDPTTPGTGPGKDDPTITTITASPKIGLVKTVGVVVDANSNGKTDAGDTIAYTFTISNLGNVTLNPVSVADPKVPGIVCPATSLAPGASTTCAAPTPYVLTQADINAASVTNQATASGTPPTGAPVTDLSDPATAGPGSDAPTVSPLTPTSQISIVKTVGSTTDVNTNGITDAGDQLNYSFAVENLGTTTLHSVVVSDNKIGAVSCLATTLAPGASTTCTGAAYTLTQADVDLGQVTNQATATALTPLNATVSDLSDGAAFGSGAGKDDPTITTIAPKPAVGLVKSAGAIVDANSDGKVDAGDTIAYAFTVSNLGNLTLNPIGVSDPKVPNITCVATSLAPGATTTCSAAAPYVLKQVDLDAGTFSNQATASGTPPTGPAVTDLSDPTTPGTGAGKDDPTVVALAPAPAIGLVKTAGAIVDVNTNGVQDAGDTIAYSFTVSNLGNVTLNPVSVADPMLGTVTCLATSLAPGDTTTCSAPTYVLKQADINAGHVANQATATGKPPIGLAVTDLSDPTTPGTGQNTPTDVAIAQTPKIGLVKTAGIVTDANGNGKTDAGDTIAYTFTVSNLGNVTLGTVGVTDPKVPNITCLASSLAPGASTTCTSPTPYVLTLADINAASVTNQATASGKPPTGPAVTDLSDPATPGPADNAPTVSPLSPESLIGLVKTVSAIADTNGNGITDAGDKVTYHFTVENIGTTTLHGIAVNDNKIGPVVCLATTLVPAAQTTCSGTDYVITQGDVDLGHVANQATATGLNPSNVAVSDLSDVATFGSGVGKDDPTITPILQTPKLGLVKTAGAIVDANADGKVDAGDTVAYTFTVSNLGNVTLNPVSVVDPKVASISCLASTLAPAQSTTCSAPAPYVLTQADLDAGTLSNQATASGKPPSGPVVTDLSDPVSPGPGPGKDDPTVVTLTPAPAIGLVKAAGIVNDVNGNGVQDAGDTIAYTFSVSNLGNVTLNPVSVSDPKVPNITCAAASLAPSATTTCTPALPYTLTQADMNAGSVLNQATATGKPPVGPVVTDLSDPTTPGTGVGKDDPTVTALSQAPKIGVVKPAATLVDANSNGQPDVGEALNYSFQVSNLGNVTLTGVFVTDPKVSNITCAATTLLVGQATTCAGDGYVITQADIDAGKVSNQATASGMPPTGSPVTDFSDPTTAGPTGNGVTITPLVQKSAVGLVKVAGAVIDANNDSLIDVGDQIKYTFSVTNMGNTTLTGVTVADSKISNVNCAATTLAPGGVTSCTGTFYIITQTDVDAGQVTNTATVAAKPPVGPLVSDISDPTTPGVGNDTATVTSLTPTPQIGLVKTAGTIIDTNGNATLDPGDTIAYTFTVTNLGNVSLHGIAVTDSKVSPISCLATTLNPQASTTCTGPAYVITQTDIDALQVQNQATATGLSPTNVSTSDLSDATTPGPGTNSPTITSLVPKAAIGVVKTAGSIVDANGDGKVDAGDTIAYTFTVSNIGNLTLNTVGVTDTKVSGITCLATTLAPSLSTTCTGAAYVLTQADVDAGKVSNQATATGKPPIGPAVSDLSDETTPGTGVGKDDPTVTNVPQTPIIGLVKVAGPVVDKNSNGVTDAGDTIAYTFTVSNLGTVTFSLVGVSDPMVAAITCASTTLAPNATTTCVAPSPYVLTQADINVGKVTNQATATGRPPFGPDVSDVSDPTTPGPATNTPTVALLTARPAIGLVKVSSGAIDSNGNGITDVGDKIKYTFNVSNMGNVTLSPISVTDPSVANIVCLATSLTPGQATTCSGADYIITQADMDAGHVNNAAIASGTPPSGPAVTDNSDPVTPGTTAQGPTVTPLVSKPALTLVKNDSLVGAVSVGSVINYTFTVTNIGNVTVNTITLSDAGAVVTSGGPIASLAPGASDTLTFKANHVLTAGDIAAGVYQNTATVSGTPAPTGLGPTTATDSVSTPLNLNSSMTFTKSGVLANGTAVPPVAGDVVNYSFVVTNTGTSPLHNVSVSDPPINLGSLSGNERTVALLAGASEPIDAFATAAISNAGNDGHHFGAIESAKHSVVAPDVATELHVTRQLVRMSGTTPELEAGDKIGFVYTLTNAGDAAFNNVVISQPDSQAYGESLSLLLPNVTDSASIIYTRDVSADEIAAGQVMSNAYVLAHAHGRATLLEVTDGLPISGIATYETFATASITPAALPLLNAGQSFTFTAPYHLTQADIDAGVVHNTATATALNAADQTLTQIAKADVPLTQSPSIGVVKLGFLHLTGPTAAVGDPITYEFDVTNTGNVTLTNVKVADPLLTVAGGPIASLAPGVTDKVTFTATHALVLADINAGHYDNQATVTGTPPTGADVNAASDFADPTQHRPTVVTLTADPKIALLKQVANVTSGAGPAHVGDIITYQFTIKNVGNVTLNKVVVTDPLMTGAPNVVIGTMFNTLLPGHTDTSFTGKYTVTQADVDKGEVTNTATVTSEAPDGSLVQDSSDPGVFTGNAPTIQPLAQAPKISLVKKYTTYDDNNANGVLDVGDKIHYTFAIQNMGNVTLTNIKLNDLLAGAVVVGGPSIATLIPGAIDNLTFTASYVVVAADIPAGQVSNQAVVTADAPGAVVVSANSDNANPNAVTPAPTITPIVEKPSIAIIKLPPTWTDVNTNGLTDAADTLTYKFKIKNTGNVTLTNVTVTDIDPAVTISGTPISTLTAGTEDTTTFTATYVLKATDVNAGFYNNQATAFGFSPTNVKASDLSDPADYTKGAVTPFSISTTPGIAVTKAFLKFVDGVGATVTTPVAGDSIVYAITVKNTGNVALKTISLTDVNGTITGGTLANLPVNGVDTTSFTATHVITNADILAGGVYNQVKAQGLTVNTNATVSDLSDPTNLTLDNPTYVPLATAPGIAVVKKATVKDNNGNGLNDAGDEIDYTFSVINTGNVVLFDVKLADTNATLAGGPIASLAVGATDATTFTAKHIVTLAEAASGSYSNQATATAALVAAGPVVVNAVSDATGITATPKPTITQLAAAAPSFTKTADRSEVKRGEQVLYTITGNNLGAGPYNVTDIMPPGFGFVVGSATVNGAAATPTVNASSIVFNPVASVGGKITITLKLLASTTLSGGKFVNNARLIDPATNVVLAVAQASVEIVAEPVFDCSDIIGRVFDDKNGNGYMDAGEPGLPGVRLVTLNGVLINTDAEGRYHVPCAAIPDSAIGSNYLLKLDPSTLPTGYKMTTENPGDVRVTRGKVTVLNFGANFVHDVKVDVTGKAFDGDGIDLTSRWQTGIDKLCHILDQNQSELLLVYHQGGESGELAQARIDNLATQVHDQCDGDKPVKIKKRIEEGK